MRAASTASAATAVGVSKDAPPPGWGLRAWVMCTRLPEEPHRSRCRSIRGVMGRADLRRAAEFVDKLLKPRAAPIEFSPRAAAEGMRLNGFYLFVAFHKGPGAAADIVPGSALPSLG